MSLPLVVITGASSGIGEALARKFSALGHPLLLLARREDRMLALNLPNTMVRSVDVTDKAAMRSIVHFGSLGSVLHRVTMTIVAACVCHKKPLYYSRSAA